MAVCFIVDYAQIIPPAKEARATTIAHYLNNWSWVRIFSGKWLNGIYRDILSLPNQTQNPAPRILNPKTWGGEIAGCGPRFHLSGVVRDKRETGTLEKA